MIRLHAQSCAIRFGGDCNCGNFGNIDEGIDMIRRNDRVQVDSKGALMTHVAMHDESPNGDIAIVCGGTSHKTMMPKPADGSLPDCVNSFPHNAEMPLSGIIPGLTR